MILKRIAGRLLFFLPLISFAQPSLQIPYEAYEQAAESVASDLLKQQAALKNKFPDYASAFSAGSLGGNPRTTTPPTTPASAPTVNEGTTTTPTQPGGSTYQAPTGTGDKKSGGFDYNY